jgi:cytochrome c-type biogenesis protein CcmH
MNFFKIITVIIFFFFSLAVNAQDSNNKLINKISKNIRCLVCQGQSIYDSQSDFAISLKLMINKKIEEGYTEKQIYDYLINQYGEWILYDPKFNKNTFFLWLLPILVFLGGGWIIFKKTKFFKL